MLRDPVALVCFSAALLRARAFALALAPSAFELRGLAGVRDEDLDALGFLAWALEDDLEALGFLAWVPDDEPCFFARPADDDLVPSLLER